MDYLIKHRHTHTYESFEVNCMKEYHSFYFIAWLTRKRSRTNLCFVTAFRSYLPVQSGLGIQFVLAWIGLKQAGSWFRFPAWVLCFGCHVFSSTRCSGNSAGLLRCRVTSPEKLPSPLKLLSSLFCGVTALARSWTSLVGFVVRVQRAGFQVSLVRVGARSYEFRSTRELQEREEKRASTRTRASF